MNDLVIFVHGALSTKNSWNFHLESLSKELRGKHRVFFEYDLEKHSSEVLSTNLTDLIFKELYDEFDDPYQRVILIGHSFGGVLAIDAVRRITNMMIHGPEYKVLTISSPLGGSEQASYLRFMKPLSLFLKNIGSFDKFMTAFKSWKLPCKVHSIISKSPNTEPLAKEGDGVVSVESQSHFCDDKNSSHVYIISNHFEVLLNPEVTKEIKNFIKM